MTNPVSLILFTTSICPNCKPMKKTLEAIEAEYGDKVLYKVHTVDQNAASMDMARKWGVTAVPTTLIIYNQEAIGQLQGAIPKSKMEEIIEGCLQSDILQESSGGSDDSSCPVLRDSSQQEDDGAASS